MSPALGGILALGLNPRSFSVDDIHMGAVPSNPEGVSSSPIKGVAKAVNPIGGLFLGFEASL